MSTVHLEQLDFKPVASYFVAVAVVFLGTLAIHGINRRAAVLALAGTFSNTVMIGIPLVGLAYGPQGLVILLTLVSVHSLVLLTSATLVLEVAVAREQAALHTAQQATEHAASDVPRAAKGLRMVLQSARSALLHPVPLPILVGLAFAQTGWVIPDMVDKPIAWLGNAFGPLALLLVGVTLASGTAGSHWRTAVWMALAKNAAMPALVAAVCWALGVNGLYMTVMVVAAAMPIGANVFLFSQRYQVAQGEVTAAVAASTLLALVTVSLVMAILAQFA
jgi:malonate transporter